MIAVRELSFGYEGVPVLIDLSLDVAAGETLVVTGANGAGKTTLLRLLAGLESPDSGTVRRDGVVGFAPEDPTAGLFAATVSEEVAFFPRNRGLDVHRRSAQAMEAMGIADLGDRDPYTLSVGEQRRVSIASVLSGEPAVVALDEPTRGLDRRGQRDLMRRLTAVDATVIASTHASDFAYEVADRVAVLGDGSLLRVGPAPAVFSDQPLLDEAGICTPGLVEWSRRRGLDHPPAGFDEAVAMLRGQR